MRTTLLITLIAALLIIVVIFQSRATEETPTGETPPEETNGIEEEESGRYQNEVNDFSLAVPGDFSVAEIAAGEEIPTAYRANVPPCNEDVTTCVYYSGQEYEGSTFESAGVSITIAEGETADQVCSANETNLLPDEEVDMVEIDDMQFFAAQAGSAATGQRSQETRYWSLEDDTCITLVSHIGYSEIGFYEPGTIEEFTEEEREALRGRLEDIVMSFQTTGS